MPFKSCLQFDFLHDYIISSSKIAKIIQTLVIGIGRRIHCNDDYDTVFNFKAKTKGCTPITLEVLMASNKPGT